MKGIHVDYFDDDWEFNPFCEHTVRMNGLPQEVRDGMKEARSKAKKSGGLIPIVKLIWGGGHAVYIIPCRDFDDSRRYTRLHNSWVERLIQKATRRKSE